MTNAILSIAARNYLVNTMYRSASFIYGDASVIEELLELGYMAPIAHNKGVITSSGFKYAQQLEKEWINELNDAFEQHLVDIEKSLSSRERDYLQQFLVNACTVVFTTDDTVDIEYSLKDKNIIYKYNTNGVAMYDSVRLTFLGRRLVHSYQKQEETSYRVLQPIATLRDENGSTALYIGDVLVRRWETITTATEALDLARSINEFYKRDVE